MNTGSMTKKKYAAICVCAFIAGACTRIIKDKIHTE